MVCTIQKKVIRALLFPEVVINILFGLAFFGSYKMMYMASSYSRTLLH